VEISLRFRITNSLESGDYKRLAEFATHRPGFAIILTPGLDFRCVSVSPITLATEEEGFHIAAETSFPGPIGFEVCDSVGLERETCIDLKINRQRIKMSTTVAEPLDLEPNLCMVLRIVERIVNNVCARFDTPVTKMITLDAASLGAQLDSIRRHEELEKRGERPRPFGTMHATGSRDAKERASGLIPWYKEHDKTYLYDAKKVYYLLPHSFVVDLLRCDGPTLVRQEEFDKRSTDVLRDLVYKKHLKKRELSDGTVCYYGLEKKTQRYFKSQLAHRTPR
jgi:hypothetical protein